MTRPWRWITGTSSGLGLALARASLANFDVLGCSRGPSPLDGQDGYHHLFLDLVATDRIRPALEGFLHNHSRSDEPPPELDLLILNAGTLGPLADLHGTDLAQMRTVMEINLWANKALIDACLDLEAAGRLRGPGRILAISSGASTSGQRGWNAYGLSKAALNMLIKLYAAERPDRRWIAMAPGLVHTPMQDSIASGPDPETFPVVKRLLAARGTPDMPPPDEAARRILGSLDALFDHENGSYVDLRRL